MDSTLNEKIKNFFLGKNTVAAVYLFGSQASGKSGISSDVDIAVLYEPEAIPTPLEVLEIRAELETLLHCKTDLVVLNRANPILAHQVFKQGIQILVKKPKLLNHFFTKSLMEYDDLSWFRRLIEPSILKGRSYGG